MRVCIDTSTGKLIGAQSNDDAEHGALIANAVVAGYDESGIEEKVVDDAEYGALLNATIPDPTIDELREVDYVEAGATEKVMTIMLWEIMVEGRTPDEVGATALQVKRVKVKTDHPKS